MNNAPIADPQGGHHLPPSPILYSECSLYQLARVQRFAARVFLLSILSEFLGLAVGVLSDELDKQRNVDVGMLVVALLLILVILAILICRVAVVFHLAKCLKMNPPAMAAGLSVVSCLGWIILFQANKKAAIKLRSNGVRLGFLGASKAELDRLKADDAPKS